jgi:hypothetical protein
MKRSLVTADSYLPSVPRRSILRGLGATLALPWMDSLAFAEGGKAAVAAGTGAPRRWACMVFANGVNEEHWWAKGTGAGMQLSKSLQPLMDHREDLLFIDGLHLFDDTVGVHTPYFTNFLAGEKLRTGSIPDLAESVDQFMGRHVGKQTPVPVIALGTEPATYGLTGGSPAIYSATMSWSSKTTPIPPEVFPRQAFDRLFDISGLARDRSVLDFVKGQANRVKRHLDARDKDKLDEYLTSIREIEQRIEKASAEDRFEGWRPSLDKPDMERPGDGKPQNVPDHMQMMIDIMILAFRMDKTRIASLIFQKDITGMSFNFLDGVSNTGMHTISHHRKQSASLEEYQRINQFHVEMLGRMIAKMKSVDEGNCTLLDNTMLLFGSTMRDGDIHDANNVPLILAGGKNCDIRSGRTLSYDRLEDRRLCNLHLAMAQRMGCRTSQFGNSHYPLPGLSG